MTTRKDPEHVKALIKKHQQARTEPGLLRWLKRVGLYNNGTAVEMRRGDRGGTRGGQREEER